MSISASSPRHVFRPLIIIPFVLKIREIDYDSHQTNRVLEWSPSPDSPPFWIPLMSSWSDIRWVSSLWNFAALPPTTLRVLFSLHFSHPLVGIVYVRCTPKVLKFIKKHIEGWNCLESASDFDMGWIEKMLLSLAVGTTVEMMHLIVIRSKSHTATWAHINM